MLKKNFFFVLALIFALTSQASLSFAAVKQGAASLLLPTTGQAMNGQIGNGKTKVMGGVEVASIATITVLGLATGGAAVLVGAIPLAANHLWSATDAYATAKKQQQVPSQDQLYDAQNNLDYSRQRRFEREEYRQSDIRERIRMAGEQAGSNG